MTLLNMTLLSKLSDDQRIMVSWFCLTNLTISEIAQEVGATYWQVRNDLTTLCQIVDVRTRRDLKALFEEPDTQPHAPHIIEKTYVTIWKPWKTAPVARVVNTDSLRNGRR